MRNHNTCRPGFQPGRQAALKGGRTRVMVAALVAACLGITPLQPITRASAADNPRTIVEEAERRVAAKSQRYEGLLKSFDSGGKVTEKRWLYERIGANGQSKSVIRFTAPAEVRGVALLMVHHLDRASDQWMWTPAIERDRRIALQDRSTRFFGTDFSFEDLEEREVGQFDYRLIGDEAVDGVACWTIESTPRKTRSSQYTKSTIWIRKDTHAYVRMDLWVKDVVARRLAYGDLRQVQGIWTAHDLTMTDLRRNTRTQLLLDKVQYNLPLRDEAFTLEAIRR